MPNPPVLDPNALLLPLHNYIVDDLSNTDIAATAALAAATLNKLAAPMRKMLSDAGAQADDIASHFFPDADDPSTPGNLFFWPAARPGEQHTYADVEDADYSLRASVFLSERDDAGTVYPAGFSLLLKLQENACELAKKLPPAVFEKLEFQLKGSSLPAGFEFLDDSQHLPVMPNMRRQFLKAIDRAHAVTARTKRPEFEAVMLHYIWDETEPVKDFGAVLSTLAALFAAIHRQAGN